MKDFAYWLRSGRERMGLNQAQLADRIGQSSSYLSMLESRRKPPPSDEVVRKIAVALEIDEDQLLEVAHIERTPPDIQRKVLDLSAAVARHDNTRRSLVSRLLPAALYPALRSGHPTRGLPLPKRVVEQLAPLFTELGEVSDYDLFAQLVEQRFGELGDRERELLLDVVGDLAAAAASRLVIGPSSAGDGDGGAATLPVFYEIPEGTAVENLEFAGDERAVVASEYSPARYGVIINGNDLHPRIEHGDLVIIDEQREPKNGDLVAVLADNESQLRRYLDLGRHVELAGLNPQQPPLRLEPDSSDITLRGVVIRIVRDLD